jgi:hypothetical protein
MEQQLNIDQIPKQFCDKIMVGSSNQVFILMPIVGTNATAFVITPEHAKDLLKKLSEQVLNFEKNVRTIAEVDAGIPSPIQMSDLPPNSDDSSANCNLKCNELNDL